MSSSIFQFRSCKVAVIGAGPGGLVAARELRRESHNVVVFERQDQVGGTWVYLPCVDTDPLGSDPSRTIVYSSSLYSSLRTNIPREIMGFLDYPFLSTGLADRDSRRFPGHREVLLFLNDFTTEFRLTDLIRFETEVVYTGLGEDGKWRVRSRKGNDEEEIEEIFDAVVVCNGHHTHPRIPQIHGIDAWPGKQMHSHIYRIPEPFRDQTVILIGNAASAHDISRDISQVAKEVHVASRSAKHNLFGKQPGYDNMWLHPMIESVHRDGTVIFQDGSRVLADVIIHCTGYEYHFPFLDTDGLVTVEDNRVGPLYKQIFPPALAPWLSFVGLPWMAPLFTVFELQSQWIAGLLSGRIGLPSQEEMMKDVEAFYSSLEASGTPKRYTHKLGDYEFEYIDWVAAACGLPRIEGWMKKMYHATFDNMKVRPETYRDEWDDDDLVLEAQKDLRSDIPLDAISPL